MPVVSRATFTANLGAKINDNTTGDISAQDVRDMLGDLRDSAAFGLNEGAAIGNYKSVLVTGVTGLLTPEAHSGCVVKTGGDITIPTTEGFCVMVIAGGAHRISFNGLQSAPLTAGDIVTAIVEDPTTIHLRPSPAADQMPLT